MEVKTVRIEHEWFPEGMLINESDFNPDVHSIFGKGAGKSLADMTVKELRAYAGEKEIPLGYDVTTKDAILAAIQSAEAKQE